MHIHSIQTISQIIGRALVLMGVLMGVLALVGCGGGSSGSSNDNVGNDNGNISNPYRDLAVTVSGLSGTLDLLINDNLFTITENRTYPLLSQQAPGTPYQLSIEELPEGQNCRIINSSGTLNANTEYAHVSCGEGSDPAYSIIVDVQGLSSNGLVLSQGDGILNISSNGKYALPNSLRDGADYQVQVFSRPTGKPVT